MILKIVHAEDTSEHIEITRFYEECQNYVEALGLNGEDILLMTIEEENDERKGTLKISTAWEPGVERTWDEFKEVQILGNGEILLEIDGTQEIEIEEVLID